MKKIYFDNNLIKGILSKSQTQFINICKSNYLNRSYHQVQIFKNLKCTSDTEAVFYWKDSNGNDVVEKPIYKPGTEVAIAQPYSSIYTYLEYKPQFNTLLSSKGWNNKMFVEANLMPHTIKILNVRLQKLQDISEDDYFKTGVNKYLINNDITNGWFSTIIGNAYFFNTPKEAFSRLISETYHGNIWNENPYVFLYEFELTK